MRTRFWGLSQGANWIRIVCELDSHSVRTRFWGLSQGAKWIRKLCKIGNACAKLGNGVLQGAK